MGPNFFQKSPFFNISEFFEIIVIAYLSQILTDIKNSSYYRKLLKFLIKQNCGCITAHPKSKIARLLNILFKIDEYLQAK